MLGAVQAAAPRTGASHRHDIRSARLAGWRSTRRHTDQVQDHVPGRGDPDAEHAGESGGTAHAQPAPPFPKEARFNLNESICKSYILVRLTREFMS